MITLVIKPSPRGWSGAAAHCSCTLRAAIFCCNATEDRLRVGKQLSHPLGHFQRGNPAIAGPPALHRLAAVIDHETAPLSFQSLARAHQLLTLPMDSAPLFFFFAGHAY